MPRVDEYDYELPRELIAQHPLRHRADSRLMIVRRAAGDIEHAHVRDLTDYLGAGDCLVLNDTRVMLARLVGRRERTGGRWVGLFQAEDESGNWRMLCKTRGRLRDGETIVLQDREGRDAARLVILTRINGEWAARPDPPQPAAEFLPKFGRVPLPHYIRGGEMVDADLETYQTIYANEAGAVAAPTAGLHFTPDLMRRLERAGASFERLTLHVGVGTFRPISTERVEDHRLHAETGRLDDATAERLNAHRAGGGRAIAVGTTAVRLLESAADEEGTIGPFGGETNIFIHPPYRFRAVDGLLTNFHLPRSSLLVLVRAFGGDDLIRRAYEEAVGESYRFFSYGDAMLIL